MYWGCFHQWGAGGRYGKRLCFHHFLFANENSGQIIEASGRQILPP